MTSEPRPFPESHGTSRRTFFGTAGAAGAAGALGVAAVALPARRAAALPGATPPAQFLGSNQGPFKQIRAGATINGTVYPGVPGLRGVRIYGLHPTLETVNNQKVWVDHLAKAWPKPTPPPVPANAGPVVYSIYPVPEHVHDGTLTKALENLIADAPPGSYLSCWHEALSLKFPSFITSDAMYKLHVRMNVLCAGSNVTYGAIFGGGSIATLLRSAPPNLGFYGLDVYANLGIDKGLARLEDFIAQTRHKDTHARYPKLLIPECNMPISKGNDQRGEWFTKVCKRMHLYGSHSIGVLTFWKDKGHLGGPWVPTDTATIEAMRTITTKIF